MLLYFFVFNMYMYEVFKFLLSRVGHLCAQEVQCICWLCALRQCKNMVTELICKLGSRLCKVATLYIQVYVCGVQPLFWHVGVQYSKECC